MLQNYTSNGRPSVMSEDLGVENQDRLPYTVKVVHILRWIYPDIVFVLDIKINGHFKLHTNFQECGYEQFSSNSFGFTCKLSIPGLRTL